MWEITNDKWQDHGDPSACPHCGAGADRITVGLYWDFNECCWHCFICGCRAYEQAACLMSDAEIEAERVWDSICGELDEEDQDCHMKVSQDKENHP